MMTAEERRLAVERGIRIGYKDAKRSNGELRSILRTSKDDNIYQRLVDSGRIRFYRFKKWTRPKHGNGPLAIFSNPIDAKIFIKQWEYTDVAILECYYKWSDKPYLAYTYQWAIDINARKPERTPRSIMPCGTEFADCIYPIKEIYP